jgi:hypothetical protein
MKNHTKEPWSFHAQGDANEYALVTDGNRWVLSFLQNGEYLVSEQEANARRIVACVNACAGIPNAALSQGIVPVHLFSAVCEQRDANRERIKDLVACVTELISCAHPDRDHAELKRARSLLRSLGRM